MSLHRHDRGCSPDEFDRSIQDHTITCLTTGDIVGLAVSVAAGFLSLVAICYFFVIIIRNVIRRKRHNFQAKLRLFYQPMDLLMFSLICGDIVQALGMVLNLNWVIEGKTEIGEFCNAQVFLSTGLIKTIGATAVALSTLVIALYTFVGIWMGKTISSMKITLGVIVAIWVIDVIPIAVGSVATDDPGVSFMAPVPYWCWVNGRYLVWMIMSEYLWMWITLLVSILVYIPLYLWMRGNLAFDDSAWWRCHFQHAVLNDPDLRSMRRRALIMLLYPLVYCFLIVPLSVVRWMTFVQGVSMPSGATLGVSAIFGLSGFLNVVLLITTKPESRLFEQPAVQSPTTGQHQYGEGKTQEGDDAVASQP